MARSWRGTFRWTVLSVVGVVVLCAPRVAEAQSELRPINRAFEDRTRVPVSGGIRVGLMTAAAGTSASRDAVEVVLPPAAARGAATWLCLEVSTRDGRYSIRYGYNVSTHPGGVLRLLQDQKQNDFAALSGYDHASVALLASLSTNCDATAPTTFLVAGWSPVADAADAVLLLNSRVPTSLVRAAQAGSAPAEVRCTTLEGDSTAFNLQCLVPQAWFEGGSFLIRQRRGRSPTDLPMPASWLPRP